MLQSPTFLTAGPDRSRDEPAGGPHAELAAGLLRPSAVVSPKYLYDALGSALFTAITELPEYYPTRTEAAVLAEQGSTIAVALRSRLNPGFTMVDLGAGDSIKAGRLFSVLQPGRYVAVDISQDYLRSALTALQQRFPTLPMVGVGHDFAASLALPAGLVTAPSLLFYPGSSIGNFVPDDALRFLREARELSQGGALLIGADMVKASSVLESAYDDELGVTAAFNLNLLRHANRLLGSDFTVRDWRHRALFDAGRSRIEMHLEAQRAVTVRWPGAERRFEAGERIHTENSYKWSPVGFESLLRDAGWRDVQRWTDPKSWFGVFLALA